MEPPGSSAVKLKAKVPVVCARPAASPSWGKLKKAAGEPAATIHFGQITGDNFRYLQAQGVEPICLVCHGQNLAEPVTATLQQYYPDDWATGYSLGQVRGAISLTKSIGSKDLPRSIGH